MFLLNDLLIRIQNGIQLRRNFVIVIRSKLCLEVLKLLYKEGYINGFAVFDNDHNKLIVFLKYYENNPIVKKFKIISKPSKRFFLSNRKIINFLANQGLFIISTSDYGLVTSDFLFKNKLFLKKKPGGEILFKVCF